MKIDKRLGARNCGISDSRKSRCQHGDLCYGCCAVEIAKRVLKEYPLNEAWLEEGTRCIENLDVFDQPAVT